MTSYDTITRKINDALTGDTSAKTIRRVRDLLGKLTIKQIHEVKKAHHAKASGRTKAELIGKVAERIVKGQTVPMGKTESSKPCPFAAFNLVKEDVQKASLRVSETKYMEMLLAAINNVTANHNRPLAQTWTTIDSHWKVIRRVIRNESFAHDYGTMSEKSVRNLVKKLRGLYYIPATSYQAI